MPLKSTNSKQSNIKELMKQYKETGKIGTSTPKNKEKAHKQAVAIAMSEAEKSKKKKKVMTEAMEQFIDSLKTSNTESFLENVVKRGMKLCFEGLEEPMTVYGVKGVFEDATVSQVTSPDSTKTVLDTDKLSSDEIDVMQTELDTIKNQKADIEAKNAKLKEDQKKLQSTTQAMTVNNGNSTI